MAGLDKSSNQPFFLLNLTKLGLSGYNNPNLKAVIKSRRTTLRALEKIRDEQTFKINACTRTGKVIQ